MLLDIKHECCNLQKPIDAHWHSICIPNYIVELFQNRETNLVSMGTRLNFSFFFTASWAVSREMRLTKKNAIQVWRTISNGNNSRHLCWSLGWTTFGLMIKDSGKGRLVVWENADNATFCLPKDKQNFPYFDAYILYSFGLITKMAPPVLNAAIKVYKRKYHLQCLETLED